MSGLFTSPLEQVEQGACRSRMRLTRTKTQIIADKRGRSMVTCRQTVGKFGRWFIQSQRNAGIICQRY